MPAPSEASIERSSVGPRCASRSSIAASSASIPSPVSADDQETRTLRRTAGGDIPQVLALLRIEAVDLVPDFDQRAGRRGSMPSSRSTVSTSRCCASASSCEMSRTCRMTSASSHLLQRGAERRHQLRRQVGDEPDRVGQDRPCRRAAGSIARIVGSSVANSMSSASTSAAVRRLNSVDLPALV